MGLVISLPTRGRPKQLVQTLQQNLACLSRRDTMLMVQIDADDQPTIEALRTAAIPDQRLLYCVSAREDTVAAKWNRALQREADVYCCLADDDALIDKESDEKILHAASIFPDGIGAVYGHLCNASFSCCISFTKRMVDLFGYIQPEYFPYWFCDHWTDDLARLVGRISFADVRTYQCVDRSKVGRTMEMREPAWWATWFDLNYLRRRAHAGRIIDALDEPEWLKQVKRQHSPLVEYRSRWINDNVRANARLYEAWGAPREDPRYLRVKQKALDEVPGLLQMLPDDRDRAMFAETLTPPSSILNMLPKAS